MVKVKTTAELAGFSELKDLLIRTYRIDKARESVRLYFTEYQNQIFLHEYKDHNKKILLVVNIREKEISGRAVGLARQICIEALKHKKPADFLNEGFLSAGFFRL